MDLFSGMEFEIIIIPVVVIALSAGAVYFMSLLGAKEKSFEEAIAEQKEKQRSEQLLGIKPKSSATNSTKDKKKGFGGGNYANKYKKQNKKANKQQKKIENMSDATTAGTAQEEEEIEIEQQQQQHTEEIIRPETISEIGHSLSEDGNGEVVVTKDVSLPASLQNGSENDKDTQSPLIPSARKAKKAQKKGKEVAIEEVLVSDVAEVVEAPPTPEVQEPKNKPKQQQKKVVRNTTVSVVGEFSSNQLEELLSKSQLSSSDIQTLIDILLNKQQRGDSEWVNKSKNDSVATLKKQLIEKEQQSSNDQGTIQTLYAKIKELRTEFNCEKSSFTQIRKQLEDTSNAKKTELQQFHSRYQKLNDTAAEEKSQLQQQLQHIQGTLKAVQNENTGIKTALANLEKTSRGKDEATVKDNGALKEQCTFLETQLSDAINTNKELTNQNQSVQTALQTLEENITQCEKAIHDSYATQIRETGEHLANELKLSQAVGKAAESEKVSLEQELAVVQTTLDELRKSAVETERKLAESQNSERSAGSELKESENMFAELRNKLDCKTSLLNNLTDDHKILEAKIISLTQTGSCGNEEIHKFNEKISELQKVLSQHEAKVQLLDTEKRNLMNVSETTKVDLKSQREKNQELRQMTTQLSEALKAAESKLETQTHEAESMTKELVAVTRQDCEHELRTTLKNLFHDVNFEGKGDWKQNFVTNLQERLIPTSNVDELSNKNDVELEKYKMKLHQTEEKLHAEVERAADTERDWRTKLENSIVELAAANAEIKNVEVRSQQATENDFKTSLERLFPDMNFEITDNWRTSFASIQDKLKFMPDLNEEVSRLSTEVNKYEVALGLKEATLKSLTETEDNLRTKLDTVEAELRATKAAAETQGDKSTDVLQKTVDQLTEEKLNLTQKFSELENNFQNLKLQTDEIPSLREKLESVEKDLDLERKLKSSLTQNTESNLPHELDNNDLESSTKDTNGLSDDRTPEDLTPKSTTPQPPSSPQLSSTATSPPDSSSGTSSDQPKDKDKSKKKKGASKN